MPPFGVMIGVATVSASVMLREKTVDLFTPPPIAVMVIVYVPAGVDPTVPIVSTVEQAGVKDVGEKDAVAPEGSPETLKESA